MQIETTPVRALRPHPNNAKKHPRKQIQKIAQSIQKFGFNNPVLINDENQVIAGHGRVEAAKLLGMETVPTCKLSHLSEAETRAYILADNKLAELGDWDQEKLAIELQGLIELDVDIELTGFETAEVDSVVEKAHRPKRHSKPKPAIESLPSPGFTVTQPGDLWLLGKHRLLCADPCVPASYDRLLEGAKAELAISNLSGADAVGSDLASAPKGLLERVFARLAENTASGSNCLISTQWHCMPQMLATLDGAYELVGMDAYYPDDTLALIWKLRIPAPIEGLKRRQMSSHRANFLDDVGVADTIKECSRLGAIVLDPFGVSGATVIASEHTERKARVIESNPAYADVTVRRWQAQTGKTAVHVETDETFETINACRAAQRAAA